MGFTLRVSTECPFQEWSRSMNEPGNSVKQYLSPANTAFATQPDPGAPAPTTGECDYARQMPIVQRQASSDTDAVLLSGNVDDQRVGRGQSHGFEVSARAHHRDGRRVAP